MVVLLPIGVFILRHRVQWPLLATNCVLLVLNLATAACLPPSRIYIAGAVFGTDWVIQREWLCWRTW